MVSRFAKASQAPVFSGFESVDATRGKEFKGVACESSRCDVVKR